MISADLGQIADPQERDLAALILQRIRTGCPFDFHYFGGSEPGKPRRVLPVQVFTTALDGTLRGAGDPNPLYLLAWCQARNALSRQPRLSAQSNLFPTPRPFAGHSRR